MSNRELDIEINADDTIDTLKEKIEEKEKIPPTQQKLIFNGTILDKGNKKLSAVKLQHGNVLHMVLALRGG